MIFGSGAGVSFFKWPPPVLCDIERISVAVLFSEGGIPVDDFGVAISKWRTDECLAWAFIQFHHERGQVLCNFSPSTSISTPDQSQ